MNKEDLMTGSFFTNAILAFPVIVVTCVAIALLCGGTVNAWQWWLSVALVNVVAMCQRKVMTLRLRDMLSFDILLLILWVLVRITISFNTQDSLVSHSVATRMLIDGWNPIWMPDAGSVRSSVGVSPCMMCPYHVLTSFKSAYYFNAAAFFFTRSPFNLNFGLAFLLTCSVFVSVWKAFPQVSSGLRISLCVLLLAISPRYSEQVDYLVCMCGVGLLLGMYGSIKGRTKKFELLVYSFWMATIKPASLLSCLCFWTLWIVAYFLICRSRPTKKSLMCLLSFITLFSIVMISPIITSKVHYGSFFYPRCSGNPAYPAINITGDFLDMNDDARELGAVGAFVNAFVSSDVAQAYYKLRLGKKSFEPVIRAWGSFHDPGTPTSSRFRFFFTATVLCLLLLGGRAERIVVLLAIIGVILVPPEMIGYVRYVKWICVLPLIAIPTICVRIARLGRKFPRLCTMKVVCATASFGLIALSTPRVLLDGAYVLDANYSIKKFLNDRCITTIYYCHGDCCNEETPLNKIDSPWPCRQVLGNLVCLKRHVSELDGIDISDDKCDALTLPLFFDGSFSLPHSIDRDAYSGYWRLNQMQGFEKLREIPKFIIKCWFVLLPRSFGMLLTA